MHDSTLQQKGHEYPKYLCSTYCRAGNSNSHGCGCHAVLQDHLVKTVIRQLTQRLLRPDMLARFKTELRHAAANY